MELEIGRQGSAWGRARTKEFIKDLVSIWHACQFQHQTTNYLAPAPKHPGSNNTLIKKKLIVKLLTDLLAMTTVAPNLDSISAIPLPSPVPPPVMNAVLFTKQFLGNIGSVRAGNLELMAREMALICVGFRAKLKIFRCMTRDEAI